MIPRTVLVASEPLNASCGAARVAEAIGRGLRAGDPTLRVDACPLEGASALDGGGRKGPELTKAPRGAVEAANLDARLRRARVVVITTAALNHETLRRGGGVFEIATRARQGGVPACAIAGCNRLDLFEARILDLQIVLEADDTRRLTAAGRSLAEWLLDFVEYL